MSEPSTHEIVPEVLRVKDFCLKYSISRASLYREINAHRLQAIKRGRLTLITRAEAERWFHDLAHYKTKEHMNNRYSAASEKST